MKIYILYFVLAIVSANIGQDVLNGLDKAKDATEQFANKTANAAKHVVHGAEHVAHNVANDVKHVVNKTVHEVKHVVNKTVHDVNTAGDLAKAFMENEAHKAKVEMENFANKTENSIREAAHKTENAAAREFIKSDIDFQKFSHRVGNKLEQLKIKTEHELAIVAAKAGNTLEMKIQKTIVKTEAKEEHILQTVDQIFRYIRSESPPGNKCHISQYINCVVHHKYTFSQGIKSQCATENSCTSEFLNSTKIHHQVEQAQIGVQSLQKQNTLNEFKNQIHKQKQSIHTVKVNATHGIENNFLIKARKIMISAGCNKVCIDKCTVSMKEYLTNSCEKCSCNSQKTSVKSDTSTEMMVVVDQNIVPKMDDGQLAKQSDVVVTISIFILGIFIGAVLKKYSQFAKSNIDDEFVRK